MTGVPTPWRPMAFSLLALSMAAGARAGRAQAIASPTVVPIEVFNNHVYVRMTSGGHDLWPLLDTGAGTTLLDLASAQALGLRLGQPVNVRGAGAGTARGSSLVDAKVVLPQDSTLAVSPRLALPMIVLNTFEGRSVNGILGADFIGQKVLQLDYVGRRLLLHDSRTFRYEGKGTSVPVQLKAGHPHVAGRVILSDGASLPADCEVDIGSSAALGLTRPFVEKNRLLERVGPTIRRTAGRGVGGATRATIGRIKALGIGDQELSFPITALYGDSSGVFSTDETFECNVGGDVMRRFTVFLDYAHKQMILEPNAVFREPFETDMSGAGFKPDTSGAGLRVSDIMPGGPAAAAGLAEGDLIVTVDGRPALDYGIDSLRRRLRRDGGEIRFVVRRADGDHTIRLAVRRLV